MISFPRMLFALIGPSALMLASGLASAAPVEAEDAEWRAAKHLEDVGEYESAAERWSELARSSLDPMTLLFADSAWARAYAEDGELRHLCASVELSGWFLERSSLDPETRAEVEEFHEQRLSATVAAGGCPAAEVEVEGQKRSKTPLLGAPPSSREPGASARRTPDDDDVSRAPSPGHGLRTGGAVMLTTGSLLAVGAITGGALTIQASAEIAAARDRHVAAGTQPSQAEHDAKAVTYRRGESAEQVAIGLGTAAVVALGVGAILVVRGKGRGRKSLTTLGPTLGPHGAGLNLGGRF